MRPEFDALVEIIGDGALTDEEQTAPAAPPATASVPAPGGPPAAESTRKQPAAAAAQHHEQSAAELQEFEELVAEFQSVPAQQSAASAADADDASGDEQDPQLAWHEAPMPAQSRPAAGEQQEPAEQDELELDPQALVDEGIAVPEPTVASSDAPAADQISDNDLAALDWPIDDVEYEPAVDAPEDFADIPAEDAPAADSPVEAADDTDPAAQSQSTRQTNAAVTAAATDQLRDHLIQLGLPEQYAEKVDAADGFASLAAALQQLPVVLPQSDAAVVAVVGYQDSALWEAHRVAIEMPAGDEPRSVIFVPAQEGPDRQAALHRIARRRYVIAAVEATKDIDGVRDALTTMQPAATVVVMDAADTDARHNELATDLQEASQVSALSITNVHDSQAPAQALHQDIPVWHADGQLATPAYWAALLYSRAIAR